MLLAIAHVSMVVLALTTAPASGSDDNSAALFRQLDADGNGAITSAEVDDAHALLFARLLRTSDQNDDGGLSADEFAAATQPIRAEKKLVKKQGGQLPGADALTVLIAKMDANGDLQLVTNEVPTDYRRPFAQMLRIADSDANGRLDAREIARSAPRLAAQANAFAIRTGIDVKAEFDRLPPQAMAAVEAMNADRGPGEMLADPRQAGELFRRLDADGDGRLSADEAPPRLADRFAQLLARGDRDGDGQLSQDEFRAISRRIARSQELARDRKNDAETAKKIQAAAGDSPAD